jgi:hypothetical protein
MEQYITIHDLELDSNSFDEIIQEFEKHIQKIEKAFDIQFSWETKKQSKLFEALSSLIVQYCNQEHCKPHSPQTSYETFFGKFQIYKMFDNPKQKPMVDIKLHENEFLKYIVFLNDMEAGEIEFFNQYKIQPKQGRIVVFPSSWIFTYKQYNPKDCIGYYIKGGVFSKCETKN